MKIQILLLLIVVSAAQIFSQQSGRKFYRSAVIDGNNIKTVFGNWGVLGEPSDSRPHGAWMYPTNGYIGDESIFIGLEFPMKDYNNDGKSDTVHSVITCPVSRPARSLDQDPNSGASWTFMPESSSVNPTSESVPLSSLPSTWPPSWTDTQGNPAWKGMFGPSTFVGSLEAFYTMSDENDHRFDTPANNSYKTNFTGITGQGIRLTVRFIQSSDPTLENILFRICDVTNLGKLKYNKVIFGSLMGTYVGLTGNIHTPQEYDDDYSILMKKEGVVITGDFPNDNSRNPSWVGPVGKYGVGFVDAPLENALGSFYYFTSSGVIPLGDDEQLWSILKEGKYTVPFNVVNDTIPTAGSDGDFVYGSYSFPLDTQKTKRIATVLAYGYTNAEVLANVERARKYYREHLLNASSAVQAAAVLPTEFSISQNYPNPFNPSTTLRYGLPMNSRVVVRIYNILGQQVSELVNSEQSAGWYRVTWDASVSSGIYFYRFEAVSQNDPDKRFVDVKKMILMR